MNKKKFRKVVSIEILTLSNGGKTTLHGSLRNTLNCIKVMGLLPISRLNNQTTDKLRFTYRSPYTICYGFSLFGQISMALSTWNYLFQDSISLANFSIVHYYTSSLVSFLVLTNIYRCWPLIIKNVEKIEKKLPPFKRNIDTTFTMFTVSILSACTVEYVLFIFYGFAISSSCNSDNSVEHFYKENMPWIFEYIQFSLWKAMLSEILNIHTMLITAYNDLLLIHMSIYLTEHFVVHYELLKKAVQRDHFSCTEFRTQYLMIVNLVKLFNSYFGIYLITSIVNNIYWICIRLFYIINRKEASHMIDCNMKDSVYSKSLYDFNLPMCAVYSFIYLLIRAWFVLILAAKINSTALLPVRILYSLPNSKFTVEVQRYISQIKNIKVAVSYSDFFHVTRTMMITLLGTIVTYEVVLLQFH